MIRIKDKHAQEKMAIAGKLLAELFLSLHAQVIAGVTSLSLDIYIENYLAKKNMVSQTRGFRTYKYSSCISINEEVVHGVPCANKVIKSGDLVKVDICAAYNGYCADMARCFFVEEVSDQTRLLALVAGAALDKGIEQAVVGARLTNISAAIQHEVERHGFGVIRDFAGHGIGRRMHEDPEILNYGSAGRGPLMQPGMAFAIEPMITAGDYAVEVLADGWTAKTVDNSLAAHVEDTVIITEHGPLVVTRL